MQGPHGAGVRGSVHFVSLPAQALILPPSFIPKGPCSPPGSCGAGMPLSLTQGHRGSRVQDLATTVPFPPRRRELDPRYLWQTGDARAQSLWHSVLCRQGPTKVRSEPVARTKQDASTQLLLLPPGVESQACPNSAPPPHFLPRFLHQPAMATHMTPGSNSS